MSSGHRPCPWTVAALELLPSRATFGCAQGRFYPPQRHLQLNNDMHLEQEPKSNYPGGLENSRGQALDLGVALNIRFR